jgi:hypothetical protein
MERHAFECVAIRGCESESLLRTLSKAIRLSHDEQRKRTLHNVLHKQGTGPYTVANESPGLHNVNATPELHTKTWSCQPWQKMQGVGVVGEGSPTYLVLIVQNIWNAYPSCHPLQHSVLSKFCFTYWKVFLH